jgi:PIN domain nuclease of toxin-antitoxin system
VKLLVDTHCWLWLSVSPERISKHAMKHLKDEDNELFLSAASAWEIAIKYSIGKLRLPAPPREFVPRLLTETQTYPMAVQHDHAFRTAELPNHHADPFDRLLIAQAQAEGMPIVTHDQNFKLYDVKIIAA